jgi:hypothetical protein
VVEYPQHKRREKERKMPEREERRMQDRGERRMREVRRMRSAE